MKPRRWLCAALAVLPPLALLAPPHASFYVDWFNNLWLTGLYGGHIRWHGAAPIVLSTDHMVGMATPLFYGYLLYPLLGFFGSVFGAHLAIRIGCLLLLAAQYAGLAAAGRNLFRHRGLQFALAATVLWSAYSLTNLYNRSAIPEYFATGFLMASLGFLAAALSDSRAASAAFHLWMGALCAAFSLGCHPPTAAMAFPLLAGLVLLAVGTWACRPRRVSSPVRLGAAAALLGAAAVAPWVYVNLRLARKLAIWASPSPLMIFPERSDNLLGRLSPLPYDALANIKGVDCSTPYLEAPIAFALWLLLGWLVVQWLRARRAPGAARSDFGYRFARVALPATALWAVFLIALSLSPALLAWFPILGSMLQFAYRLVSHGNAALLAAVLAAALLAGPATPERARSAAALAAACIALAAAGLGLKLMHGFAVFGTDDNPAFAVSGPRAGLIDGPATATGLESTYTTPDRVRRLSPSEAAGAVRADFPVGTRGRDFGRVHPARVRLAAPGWVLTNVAVFPWSRITANGRPVRGPDLAQADSRFALHLPAGPTTLGWTWRPDPVWAALHALARWALAALLLGAAALAFRAARPEPEAPRRDAPR